MDAETGKSTHKCAVCGKGYYSCNNCNQLKGLRPWRSVCDTIDHYKIFCILIDYNNQHCSKAEAREKLWGCDLSDELELKPEIQKQLKVIKQSES